MSEVCFILADVCVAVYRTLLFNSVDAHIVIVIVVVLGGDGSTLSGPTNMGWALII